MAWPANDPRRALIQSGDMKLGDAVDGVAMLPEDCTADEAFGYIQRSFVRNSGRAEVKKLLDRVDEYNDRVLEANLEPTVELTEELVRTNAPTLFEGKHIPKSTKVGPRSDKDEKKFQEFLHDAS
jgi:hypothetical protein